MKNVTKSGLLNAVVAILSSACLEPKNVQYYEDPRNVKELEAKIKECDKNANSAENDTKCANACRARYSKSLQKPRESAMEFFKNQNINDK